MQNLTADWDLLPGEPALSPDGRFISFSAGIGGDVHLFRLPAAGGAVEQVTTGSRRLGGILALRAAGTGWLTPGPIPCTPRTSSLRSAMVANERRLTRLQ
jgi:hypothetical protein